MIPQGISRYQFPIRTCSCV